MSAVAWFGLGFLSASIGMWFVMWLHDGEVRLQNRMLARRARLAEQREQQAVDRALLAEQWSQMLGASLYGEAKDSD